MGRKNHISKQRQQAEPDTESTLSKDAIFSTLSSRRRRHVIHYLNRHLGPVAVRDLAKQVAAWENDTSIEELTYKERKRVYTSLYQTHLPKMDDSGIVAFDRERGTVTLRPRAAALDIYLEVVPRDELPWSEFYLGLAAFSLAAVTLQWAGVYPLSLVSPLALAGVIAVSFVVTAVLNARTTRRVRLGESDAPPDVGTASSRRSFVTDYAGSDETSD